MTKISVLIADDHTILRKGILSLLEDEPEITVVGEAADGIEAVRLARKLKPQVVVVDISMPQKNGLEATREILRSNKATKVLMLSMHGTQQYIVNSLKAGASGYILKKNAVEELIAGIRTVIKGKRYLSPSVSDILLEDVVGSDWKPEDIAEPVLSSRQKEILQLIAMGNTMNEIAELLHLSVFTATTHRKMIMKKLNLHNTADLTRYAIRKGLVDINDE
ncbi:MAG: response regulator [Fidelibacterota bacterium]